MSPLPGSAARSLTSEHFDSSAPGSRIHGRSCKSAVEYIMGLMTPSRWSSSMMSGTCQSPEGRGGAGTTSCSWGAALAIGPLREVTTLQLWHMPRCLSSPHTLHAHQSADCRATFEAGTTSGSWGAALAIANALQSATPCIATLEAGTTSDSCGRDSAVLPSSRGAWQSLQTIL